MKRKLGCLIALGCVLLMAAGCAKKAPQKATLTVPSNPSTGFEWFFTQDPEIFDITSEVAEVEEEDEEEGIVGAGENEIFTLTPKAEGTATVEFLYERSWEDEEPETRLTYTLKVTKDMQITVEAFTSAMGGDMDTLPEPPEMVIE